MRAVERLVQEQIADDPQRLNVVGGSKRTKQRTKAGQIASLEQELRRALGAKVDIHVSASNRGKIVIHFKGHGEFERLRGYLLDDSLSAQATGSG